MMDEQQHIDEINASARKMLDDATAAARPVNIGALADWMELQYRNAGISGHIEVRGTTIGFVRDQAAKVLPIIVTIGEEGR